MPDKEKALAKAESNPEANRFEAASNPEADRFTAGFKAGIVVQDPADGAIVARGRTTLGNDELARALWPALSYLGVKRDDFAVAVDDGVFELRVAKHAADASSPALESAKVALQVFVGFGLFGLALHQLVAPFAAAIVWGIALILGGWQLRRGLASGRAMLAARLAVALGLLASEDKAILPPPEKGA
jgi:hypothetical protein